MRKFKVISIFTILIFIIGCSNNQNNLEVKECNFPDSPSSKAPLWVCGGKVEELSIYAVGSTNQSRAGVNFMLQQASANARVFLAQQIQANIQAQVKNFAETTGSGDSETVDQVATLASKQITDQNLQGTKIYKQITSPNGILYVLVGLDGSLYKNFVKESLETSYMNDRAVWQKAMGEKAFEDLKKAIDDNRQLISKKNIG